MLAPRLLARDLRAVVRFDETGVAVQSVEAEVAGGRMTAELSAERRLDGLVAQGQVRFVNADAGDLLPGDGVLSGRITLDMTAKGSGRSASALIGSLAGNGSFTLQNGKVEHLDPTVFDAVIRAVDGGLPVDAARVRNWLDKALAARALPVNLAEGTVTLTAGQARLSNTVVHTPAAELTAGGSINLVDGGTRGATDAGWAVRHRGHCASSTEDRDSIERARCRPEADDRRRGARELACAALGRAAIEKTGGPRRPRVCDRCTLR